MTATADITLGAEKLLIELGYAPLREVTLNNNRRVDILGLNAKGKLIVVEVKSSVADFKADNKWTEYLEYCDEFYFAVNQDFPTQLLEEETSQPLVTGIIVADAYGGEILREASVRKTNAIRAKNLVKQMARSAALRLFEKTND